MAILKFTVKTSGVNPDYLFTIFIISFQEESRLGNSDDYTGDISGYSNDCVC